MHYFGIEVELSKVGCQRRVWREWPACLGKGVHCQSITVDLFRHLGVALNAVDCNVMAGLELCVGDLVAVPDDPIGIVWVAAPSEDMANLQGVKPGPASLLEGSARLLS